MKRISEMRPSTKMWLGIGAAIGAYEYFAPEGELLSEAVDRGLESKHRALVIGGIAITAAHLLNVFDHYDMKHLDPYSAVLSKIRRVACEQAGVQIPEYGAGS